MIKKLIDKCKNKIFDLQKLKQHHLDVIAQSDSQMKKLNISKDRDWCLFNQWVEVKVREKNYISEIDKKVRRLNFKLSLYAVMASF